MQQFKEMKEIMHVEDEKFDLMACDTEKILNNAFIKDCDEYGIRKYESMLGIVSVFGEGLELRKNRIMAYWRMGDKYGYNQFLRSLNILLDGSYNYDMICDLEHYRMTFHVYKDEHLSMLDEFLQKVLPINVFYDVHVTKDWSGSHYVGIVWQDDEIMEWR